MERATSSEAAPQGLEEALAALCLALASEPDLSRVWSQFQAAIDRHPGLVRGAQFERSPAIERFLEEVGERALHTPGKLHNVALMHVAPHGFWHGGGRLGPWVVACFFFEELGMGLAGFVDPVTTSGVELIRMTIFAAPEDGHPRRPAFVGWSPSRVRAKA